MLHSLGVGLVYTTRSPVVFWFASFLSLVSFYAGFSFVWFIVFFVFSPAWSSTFPNLACGMDSSDSCTSKRPRPLSPSLSTDSAGSPVAKLASCECSSPPDVSNQPCSPAYAPSFEPDLAASVSIDASACMHVSGLAMASDTVSSVKDFSLLGGDPDHAFVPATDGCHPVPGCSGQDSPVIAPDVTGILNTSDAASSAGESPSCDSALLLEPLPQRRSRRQHPQSLAGSSPDRPPTSRPRRSSEAESDLPVEELELPERPPTSPPRRSSEAEGSTPVKVVSLSVYCGDAPRHGVAVFLRQIRQHLDGATLEGIFITKDGYRIRTKFPDAVVLAVQKAFPRFEVKATPSPVVPKDIMFRGVPSDISKSELEEDLKSWLQGAFISVRRLHALTEGNVDSERPLPVIVVRVDSQAVERARHWRLFDAVPVKPGPTRDAVLPVQCVRCWGWGHKVGACVAQRRCFHCGSRSHSGQECTRDRSTPFCFACKGEHSVRWGGCSARKAEDLRVRSAFGRSQALPPGSSHPLRSVSDARVKPNVSYASSTGLCPGPAAEAVPLANRWSGLDDEAELQVDMDIDLNICGSGSEGPSCVRLPSFEEVKRKRRLVKAGLADGASRLGEVSAELAHVEAGRLARPNVELDRRARSLRRKVSSLKARLAVLDDEDRELSKFPLTPPEARSRSVSPVVSAPRAAQPARSSSPARAAGVVPSEDPSPPTSAAAGFDFSWWPALLEALRSAWGPLRSLLLALGFKGAVSFVDGVFRAAGVPL